MSKKTIFLCNGGLGNQLFQIAAAVGYSNQHKEKTKIAPTNQKKLHGLYSRFLESLIPRLSISDIQLELTKPNQKLIYLTIQRLGARGFLGKRSNSILEIRQEKEPYRYEELKPSSNPRCIFAGFWQSEKYFINVRDTVRAAFLTQLKTEQEINPNNCSFRISDQPIVALHMRRGDYRQIPGYGLLDIQYYKNALETLKDKIGNHRVLVFSDEIKEVQKEDPFPGAHYFDDKGMEPTTVLSYMVNCDHFVTANSSFSWWAAYLGMNPVKKICTPSKWFRDRASTPDLIPPEWIQINNSHL